MKLESERAAAASPKPFWQRILERRQFRRQSVRPRVPLVFFRFWSFGSSPVTQTVMRSEVLRYPLHLQIQLCWPSFVKARASHVTLQQFNFTRRESRRSVSLNYSNSNSTSVANTYEAVPVRREPLRAVATPMRAALVQPTTVPQSLALPQKEVVVDRGPVRTVSNQAPRVFGNTFVGIKSPNIRAPQPSLASPAGPAAHTEKIFQHQIFLRHAIAPELQQKVAAITHLSLPVRSPRPLTTRTYRHGSGPSARGADLVTSNGATTSATISPSRAGSRLYPMPVPRDFLSRPASREESATNSAKQTAPEPQRATVVPPPPALDVSRLSEEVYRHIQRKIRIERERRGL